jgi:FkbH-like protein
LKYDAGTALERMDSLKEHFAASRFDDAWHVLRNLARTESDFTGYMKLCQWHRKLLTAAPPTSQKAVRIALLGGATTDILEAPLSLALESLNLSATIFRADYNTYAEEMLNPDGATAQFKPEVALLVITPANIPSWPNPGDSLDAVRKKVREVADHWLGLCRKLHEHTRCEIVINNFHPLPTRPHGNLAAKLPWDHNNFLRRLNADLGDRAPSYVHVNDVDALAAHHGLPKFFDQRYWFHAKQPVSFDCLVPYVRNTARVVGALFGRTAKCLVLDLDNTLWGGVIGDDGLDGIKLGEGDALGEAYKAFQQYVLHLKNRGILLAACSKNDESTALLPFEQHPEMLLKRADFVSFKANWDGKPDNLRAIAKDLNIGLDSLVFVDDNPAERQHVRQRCPEVTVIDLPEDPAGYARALDEAAPFEVTAISDEDRLRSQQYLANASRGALLESAGDYDAYLASLNQRATISPFVSSDLDRITQLINKSNQFNLTTLRLSRSQVEGAMNDHGALPLTVRLTDTFGDNGLISVFIGVKDGDALRIDLWLMSCRVLKRGVEKILLNHVAHRARQMGLTRLRGSYVPTPKNGLVKEHYASLGFSAAGADARTGATEWSLDLTTFRPFVVPIATDSPAFHLALILGDPPRVRQPDPPDASHSSTDVYPRLSRENPDPWNSTKSGASSPPSSATPSTTTHWR